MKIKIDFADFWPGFNKQDNYFWNLLSSHFDIELSSHPDIVIYSVFGHRFAKYNCLRIFYTGENVRPNFHECDFAFTFDYCSDERHYRLPIYVLYDDVRKLTQAKDIDAIIAQKTKFCNFIVSNPYATKRIEFFKKLSKYKKVDSGGKVLNNIGSRVQNKREFIKPYKFTLAFENESFPGYTTEKIFEPMLAHSIPIYWGNPLVDEDFNTKSFINYHDFSSDEEIIEHIIKVDSSPDLYRQYLSQPYFTNNKVNKYVDPENILHQFEYIFRTYRSIKPIAHSWTYTDRLSSRLRYMGTQYSKATQWLKHRLISQKYLERG